jgi:flavin reductase (DIM6/NTAB) family NADH-FMN oxidoreductase RutF
MPEPTLSAPATTLVSAAPTAAATTVPTPAQLRAAFGRFPTGVTIITCVDGGGQRIGLTANSLTSLSLDPPLLLWTLCSASSLLPAFMKATHFAVNVLADAQVDLSRRFASPVPDKFEQGAWHHGIGDVPLLSGSAATFECALSSVQEAGDHFLFIGRVLRVTDGNVPALVYHAGRYHLVGEIL